MYFQYVLYHMHTLTVLDVCLISITKHLNTKVSEGRNHTSHFSVILYM